MLPKIVAHGGAWNWDDSLDEAKRAGVLEAVALGYEVLKCGDSALDAVEKTVISLENNPIFDAGTGGYLNQEGMVQLDALIVDGADRDFGAVAGATRIQNPIMLARKIMQETDHCFFVGDGADTLAEKLGVPLIPNERLVTPEMYNFFLTRQTGGPSDTVGAVAVDKMGNTAAATSTSGTPYKPAGRVGDSPLYGAGGYAENEIGTVGATGKGEHIMRTLLAKYCCDRLAEGFNAPAAAQAAISFIDSIFVSVISFSPP